MVDFCTYKQAARVWARSEILIAASSFTFDGQTGDCRRYGGTTFKDTPMLRCTQAFKC